jgi:hypothetical protein
MLLTRSILSTVPPAVINIFTVYENASKLPAPQQVCRRSVSGRFVFGSYYRTFEL